MLKRPKRFADDGKTNIEAQYEAQKLAFGPLMFQAVRVLRDCGALDFLKSRGLQGATAEELAEAIDSLSIYASRLLLEAALASEVAVLEGDRFILSKVGLFVLADPMTKVNIDFVHDICWQAFFHFAETIAEGRPVGLAELGPWETIYEGVTHLPEQAQASWYAFEHFYSDGVFKQVLPEVLSDRPKTLLDIGGNTGKWAMLCCSQDPRIQVTIADLPGQLERALQNAMDAGYGDRIGAKPIDLLNPDAPLPSGFDAIWTSQCLDCFSEAETISILTRARKALNPGGKLFILETLWDRQRYDAARYSVIATSLYFAGVANGNSKMFHSDRLTHCVEEAGMRVEHEIDDIGMSHTLFRCVAV